MPSKPNRAKGKELMDHLLAAACTAEKPDFKDPIYDSESEGSAIFHAYVQGQSDRQDIHSTNSTYALANSDKKAMTVSCTEFVERVIPRVLPEALQSEQSGPLCDELKSLECAHLMDVFVIRAIRLSLDYSEEKQKWISELLTILFDCKLLTSSAVNKGFEKLILKADDLEKDVPRIYCRLLFFIRCAIEDDVLDGSFLQRLPESFLRRYLEDLEAGVCGSGDKADVIKEVKDQIKTLQEYKIAASDTVTQFFYSKSIDDLLEFIKEHSPHLKHELVRKMLEASMGQANLQRNLVSDALSASFGTSADALGPDSIWLGFMRTLSEIEDLEIDIPGAQNLLTKFFVKAISDEILPPVVISDIARLTIGGSVSREIAHAIKKTICGDGDVVLHFNKFCHIWLDTEVAEEVEKKIKSITKKFLNKENELTLTLSEFELLNCPSGLFETSTLSILEAAMDFDEKDREELLTELLTKLLKMNVCVSHESLELARSILGRRPGVSQSIIDCLEKLKSV